MGSGIDSPPISSLAWTCRTSDPAKESKMPSKATRRNASKGRQAAQGTHDQIDQIHQADPARAKEHTTVAVMSYRFARMPLKSENSPERLVEDDMQSSKAGMVSLSFSPSASISKAKA
jgi:hypothetical protein